MSQSPTASSQVPDEPLPGGAVVTLGAAEIPPDFVGSVGEELGRAGAVSAPQTGRFATREQGRRDHVAVSAVRWAVGTGDGGEEALRSVVEDAAARLGAGEEGAPVTATVLPAALRPASRALLLTDVDSTLIDEEVIDLIARRAGREAEVAAVTEAAMRGELDFAGSLHARVAALQGLPVSVFDEVVASVRPTCGAEELLARTAALGWPRAAVSGGFLQVLTPLAERLGLDDHHANTLAVADGRLCGTVTGEVVDRAAKARYLRERAAAHGLTPEQIVAVGDGANDVDMVAAAGVGVAFCARPVLEAHAVISVRHRSMRLIGWALGL